MQEEPKGKLEAKMATWMIIRRWPQDVQSLSVQPPILDNTKRGGTLRTCRHWVCVHFALSHKPRARRRAPHCRPNTLTHQRTQTDS